MTDLMVEKVSAMNNIDALLTYCSCDDMFDLGCGLNSLLEACGMTSTRDFALTPIRNQQHITPPTQSRLISKAKTNPHSQLQRQVQSPKQHTLQTQLATTLYPPATMSSSRQSLDVSANAEPEIETEAEATLASSESLQTDMPMTMAASVVLDHLPRDAHTALSKAGLLEQGKSTITFHPSHLIPPISLPSSPNTLSFLNP